MGRSLTHEQAYNEFKEYGYELMDVYSGITKRYHCKDVSGYDVEVYLNVLRRNESPLTFSVTNVYTINNIKKYIKDNNLKIELLSKEYKGHNELLRFKHTECGHEFERRFENIKMSDDCPYCIGQKTLKNVNDIATTHPHLIKYFNNKEDACKYSHGSSKYCITKCPICGTKKKQVISSLVQFGFSCNNCGDNYSRPNKFLSNILKQLQNYYNDDFKYDLEYHIQNYIYDGYIKFNKDEFLVEVQGNYHYKISNPKWFKSRTLEDVQTNDKNKKEFAVLKNYIFIEIDCMDSTDFDYMKNSFTSTFSEYFDMSIINWTDVYNFASGTMLEEIYEMRESGMLYREIAKELKTNRNTVSKYYKKFKEIKQEELND